MCGSTSVVGHPGDSGIIPDDGGNFAKDWNVSGVIGSWFLYQDSAGSSINPRSGYTDPGGFGPFGSINGELCFDGIAAAENADYSAWGAGLGLEVCTFPSDLTWLPVELQNAATPNQMYSAASCPTLLTGVNSVTFTVSGTIGTMRVAYVTSNAASDVAPFFVISSPGTYTVTAGQTQVPADWGVPNAGETGNPDIYALHWQVASQPGSDTSFGFCISNVSIG